MARIAGVDLPRNKRIEIALTYIYGLGRHAANVVLKQAGISPDKKSDDLDESGRSQDPRCDRERTTASKVICAATRSSTSSAWSISARIAACVIAATCRPAVSARTRTPAPARVRAAWR